MNIETICAEYNLTPSPEFAKYAIDAHKISCAFADRDDDDAVVVYVFRNKTYEINYATNGHATHKTLNDDFVISLQAAIAKRNIYLRERDKRATR